MAHDPKDPPRGVAEDPRGGFVEEAEFVVREIVAQLLATCHAEGHEAVASAPTPEGEWQGDAIGVEGGHVGAAADGERLVDDALLEAEADGRGEFAARSEGEGVCGHFVGGV